MAWPQFRGLSKWIPRDAVPRTQRPVPRGHGILSSPRSQPESEGDTDQPLEPGADPDPRPNPVSEPDPSPDPRPEPKPTPVPCDSSRNCRHNQSELRYKPRPEPPKDEPDYGRWEAEYAEWGNATCGCNHGYYCRAHGLFVSGYDVRTGRAPRKSRQGGGQCHPRHG